MKTRSDFVSNSSSCSFVINDVAKAAAVISEDLTSAVNDIPYDVQQIEVGIIAKRKDMKSICELLEHSDYDEQPTCSCSYMNGHQRLDPNEVIVEWGFDIENVLRMLTDKNLIADPRFSLIQRIRLEANDYQSQLIMYLCLLNKYMKSRGVDVDDTGSEHSPLDYGSAFVETLIQKIYGSN